MEVAQFYLHLPSNSSLNKFPNNTLTEYRVGLPQTVSLTGDWEVGLTEIHYPDSWNNVQGNLQGRFYVRNQELDVMWEALIVPPRHYSSIEANLSIMKELVDNEKRFLYYTSNYANRKNGNFKSSNLILLSADYISGNPTNNKNFFDSSFDVGNLDSNHRRRCSIYYR